jgi:predicted Zn-dependent peptidase
VALDAGGDYLTTKDPGLFTLWATCTPGNVEAARAALLGQVRQLRKELISAEELVKAKRLLSTSYVFSNETFGDQATALGYYDAVGNYRLACDYLPLLNSLTATELRDFAVRYLDPDRYVCVVGGPPSEGK